MERNGLKLVLSGHASVFKDYLNNGPMWSGKGERETRAKIIFSEPFETSPHVLLSIRLMDSHSESHQRWVLFPDNITERDFEIVFKTWEDSRYARVEASWIAIGNKEDTSLWNL